MEPAIDTAGCGAEIQPRGPNALASDLAHRRSHWRQLRFQSRSTTSPLCLHAHSPAQWAPWRSATSGCRLEPMDCHVTTSGIILNTGSRACAESAPHAAKPAPVLCANIRTEAMNPLRRSTLRQRRSVDDAARLQKRGAADSTSALGQCLDTTRPDEKLPWPEHNIAFAHLDFQLTVQVPGFSSWCSGCFFQVKLLHPEPSRS